MTYALLLIAGFVVGWICSHLHLPIRLRMSVPLTQERVQTLIFEERRQAGK